MSTNQDNNRPVEPPAELAEAIGRIASNWAALETVLDMFVVVFFHKAGGSQKFQKIPISLKQKSDLMKACLRDFPPLASYRDKTRDLLSRINHLSNDRHFVLHGMLWADVPDSQGRYEFRKFEFSNQTRLMLVNKRLTVTQIVDMSAAMYQLRTEALGLLLEIGDAALDLWIDNTTE